MRLRGLCEALCLAGLLALAGCGEGGGVIITPDDPDEPGSGCSSAGTCGSVWVSLAEVGAGDGVSGEFLSYSVDVVSIRLERASGGTVELLDERQRVDFAGLSGVARLVAVARVPEDEYVGARLRLDYSDAVVSVEVQGLPTGVAVVDSVGVPLGEVDLTVEFPDDAELVADSDLPAQLWLGFDLEATHVLNPLLVPVTATASSDPVVTAAFDASPAFSPGELTASGLLVSVDESAGSYVAELRPLGDDRRGTENGRVTVLTDADTRFEVDGDVLGRTEALAALTALGADGWTSAVGSFDAVEGTFTAVEVLAGESVPGAEFDVVTGHVVERTGNEVVLRGSSLVQTDAEAEFVPDDIRVRLGTSTVVRKEGSASELELDSVSVGSRVTVSGVASGLATAPVLDARDGRLTLHPVRIGGFVVSRTTGELRVELGDFDGRQAAFFDFDGTGVSFASSADPFNYQVDTGDFDLDEFAVDEPMQATGFVALFGDAPPDFVAESVVESEALPALLGLGWGAGGTNAPFTQLGQTRFTIDAANPALGIARRFLERGPERLDVGQLGAALRVEPAEDGTLLFAVVREGRVESFREFADFVSRVSSLLGSGRNMRSLTARGAYDEDLRTLDAEYVAVTF
jgi:hypothetical protein